MNIERKIISSQYLWESHICTTWGGGKLEEIYTFISLKNNNFLITNWSRGKRRRQKNIFLELRDLDVSHYTIRVHIYGWCFQEDEKKVKDELLQ